MVGVIPPAGNGNPHKETAVLTVISAKNKLIKTKSMFTKASTYVWILAIALVALYVAPAIMTGRWNPYSKI